MLFSSLDILHSVLGLPSECTHNNVIRSCTLSFSCWIQGGRHAEGCGENKWLFSCCISDNELDFNSAINHNTPIKSNYFDNDPPMRFNMGKMKAHMMTPTAPPFKHNMLRRRMDDNDATVCFVFYSIPLLVKYVCTVRASNAIQYSVELINEYYHFRISWSVEFHERRRTPSRSELSAVELLLLPHSHGKRTFASLNINVAAF